MILASSTSLLGMVGASCAATLCSELTRPSGRVLDGTHFFPVILNERLDICLADRRVGIRLHCAKLVAAKILPIPGDVFSVNLALCTYPLLYKEDGARRIYKNSNCYNDHKRQKQNQQRSGKQKVKRLQQTLETFLPRAEQIIDQTTRRIFQGEQVPASEKIVSLFEEHTDIICRGKESRPVEYGHKIWLNEVEGGLVSHYRILAGNPSDEEQWKPSLKAHLKTFHQPPQQASDDRGLYSESNEQLAHHLDVKHVILPHRGHPSKARLKHERKAWFVKRCHWHAGVEGRISVLKRAHGLGRCLAHGLNGFQRWVGWGVIAGNLAVLGRT
jgi:hypothetical protein